MIEIKNLEITSAISKIGKRAGEAKNRKSNLIIVRMNGSAEYCFEDKTLKNNGGELIFIPKGSTYTWRVTCEEDCNCLLIYFNCEYEGDATAAVYPLDNFVHIDVLCNNFSDLWNFGNAGEKYQCYSYMYELLSYMYNFDSFKSKDKAKFSVIEPAVKYLRKHIYDSSLKIDRLHNLCGLSHTYFRKVYIKEMGMNPKEYVIEKRLSHAKIIIENGDMDTVEQLSLSVGYDDPLYFSKAFKKKFGISPSKMNLL